MEAPCGRAGARSGLISLIAGFNSRVRNCVRCALRGRAGARLGLISPAAGFESRVRDSPHSHARPGRPTGRAGRSRACLVWVRLPLRSLGIVGSGKWAVGREDRTDFCPLPTTHFPLPTPKRGRPRAGVALRTRDSGVRLSAAPLRTTRLGPWSSGMTPVWHAGSPGSTPGGSTRSARARFAGQVGLELTCPADWGSPRLARDRLAPATYGREPDTVGRAAVLTQLPSRACGFESHPLRFGKDEG